MIKNNEYETKKINKRTNVLLYFMFMFIAIISARVIQLQFFEHEKYAIKSINNVTKDIKISPRRGNIYDKNNNLIATNRPLYELIILPEKIYGYRENKEDSIDNLFRDLSKIIDISIVNLVKKKNEILKSSSFIEVVLMSDLTESQLSEITANLKYIDGVSVNVKYVRSYPFPKMYLSLLGYVGRIDDKDLIEYKDLNVLKNDFMGKIGLEKSLNERLYGKVGIEKVIINAAGKIIDRYKNIKPVHGEDIYLSIDHELQKIAYDSLTTQNKKGAVVAMDLETGDILAFFSNPTYDANKFIKGISHKDYARDFKKDTPLFNRVIQGQYPPASTIKPFMAMAAYSGDFIDPKEVIFNAGRYRINKQVFRDWKRSGHGNLDMKGAIARSSDVYFYKLAHQMGIDYIHDYLSYFGFGERVDIPFPNQASGLLPSNSWKKRVHKEPFYAGDTVIVGIGQGAFLATPIQLLRSTSIIALNGRDILPKFEKKQEIKFNEDLKIPKEYYLPAKEGMKDVIHSDIGTSRDKEKTLGDYLMAGKTGTAQVFSTKGEINYENEDMPEHLKDHGLFISYAPYDNPKIAVVVVVEHGYSGNSSAAPIAIDITNKYMESIK
jgi:penicillin-binding protein 2